MNRAADVNCKRMSSDSCSGVFFATLLGGKGECQNACRMAI